MAKTIVIGGGLAGLACAATLAKAGAEVVVLERARALGGRARTRERDGFLFNQGAHALYRRGAGAAVLGRLGVRYDGWKVPNGGEALLGDAIHPLPMGPWTMLTSGLMSAADKLAFTGWMGRAALVDPDTLADLSLDGWLAQTADRKIVRQMVRATARITTYANAPDRLQAAALARQLQIFNRGGVLYLHGGWRTLIAGLAEVARAAGAEIRTGASVQRVERAGDGALRVALTDEELTADAAVLAVPPAVAARLAPDDAAIQSRAQSAVPARATCLDLALRALPDPKRRFVLGIDRAIYMSAHTPARLAPEGQHLVHLLRYLAPGENPAPAAELEALMDRAQPGWRDHEVSRQYLPEMLACGALPLPGPARGGPAVDGSGDLYVAGDWVGEHHLADAALDSGERAARQILERAARAEAA